ncbi:MAG: DUF362 domain-containing protein [Myxococcota bacterium]
MSKLRRRHVLATTLASSGVAATGLTSAEPARAAKDAAKDWAARPPKAFQRLSLPGKVVRVHKAGSMQEGGVYPEPEAAAAMVRRAMTELTGEATAAAAFKQLIHPEDVVAIKPNGIAGRKTMKMATNKEVVLEVVRGVIAAGVPAEKITIYEQYRDFLFATRCITDKATLALAPEFPAGVQADVHLNKKAVMDAIVVGQSATKYVTPFTDATVVINVPQVKDHNICGYTGAMKNITHGSNINPHDYHKHNASPQIAHLFAQDVVKSRMALHIADAFQVIYDEGPIDKNPRRRVLHESIYAATDPVAIDVVGWRVVDGLRRDNGLPSLADAGREPTYLRVASELGLGVYDEARIDRRDIEM